MVYNIVENIIFFKDTLISLFKKKKERMRKNEKRVHHHHNIGLTK